MKYCETKKVFYKKYLYKITIRTNLSYIFRSEINDKHFNFAKQQLLRIKEYRNNTHDKNSDTFLVPIGMSRFNTHIDKTDYKDTLTLFKILRSEVDDFKIRCEMNSLIIYSNNEDFIDKIICRLINDPESCYKPSQANIDFLKKNVDVIISNKPVDYEYKITLKNNNNQISKPLSSWLKSNKKNTKIGEYALHNLEHGYSNGSYFYVKDSKILMLVQLSFGNFIRKVERMVYVETDK